MSGPCSWNCLLDGKSFKVDATKTNMWRWSLTKLDCLDKRTGISSDELNDSKQCRTTLPDVYHNQMTEFHLTACRG